ncbi:hypothetical protein, variant [Capsaspora owczarzaki ATCC 30864]|uniref:Intersectin 1 n=1 Tax=Capsaspora owczarzaki (strain ATCC 30864) TaxID=595528 RepID=A0A0D2X5K3_CAPO3|nr:hypothetical protein, variant [Capsaspora owczarzaki ATCC 30864]KJE97959.1 hypothetical protein CAOG_008024 [Capsaspora owczarzaki ATCC 30864]|eukprot:XP_011270854.1 hypothetical protein, variant [Capsaspora owczarzaki ATCC 30864]
MASPDPWTITPAQLGRYLPMFNELRPVNGQVAADRARPFLLQSKLSMQVLGHIWNLADLDRDGKLTAQEFSIAMCLVEAQLRGIPPPPTLPPSLAASSAAANAHGGGPLSAASLMGASAGGLPAPMMPMSSTPLIPTPSGGATPLAPSPLTGLAPMMPTPVSGAPISAPVSAVGPSVPAAPALSASSSLAAAPGADDWGIPDSDRNRARLRFNELDPKRTGFLTSVIARDELTKSHLHYSILGQIWALSDLDADGKLTSDEFVIASYLVNLARAGHQLPPTLPVSLIPPSFRKRLVASGVLPPTAAGLPASSAPLGAASAAATPTPAGAPADASLVSGAGAGAGAGAAPVPVLTSSVLDNAEDRRRENFLKGQEELERRRREAEEAERKQREAADARRKAEDDARRERIEKQRQEEERLVTLAREKEAARQAELEREREALKRKEQEKMAAEAFFAWRSARLAFLTQMKNSEQESLAALQARSESLDSSLASVKSRLETATRRFAQCKEELQTERIDLEAVEESAQEKRLEAARNQQMLYDIERQTLMQRENKKAASLMISGGAGSPSISAAASAAQVQQLTEQLSLLKPQLVTLQNDLTALKPKVTQRKADLSSLTTDLTVIQDMRAQQQQRQTVLKTRKADLDKNDSQRQEYNRRKKIEGERQAAAHRRQEEAKKKQQQDQLQREKEAKEREARERETKEREAKEKEAAKQKAAAAAAAATAATAAAAAAAAASAVSATSAKPARPAPPGSKSPAAASDKPLKLAPKPPGVAANAAPARKLDVFIAQFPYTAGNDDELSFNPDDVILLVNKQDDDWWEGELNGKVGLFPSNYVRIAEPHEIPASIKSGSSAADDKKRKQEEELLRNAADLAKLEEEKRKKKAADDERARKEAEEAARKKKQEEEEAARKKKQQEAEEAAARKKKEEAEEAARKKKQAQEAEAAAAAAAATAAAAAAAAAAAKPAGEQVKALYDYKDEQSSLVFKEGDILLVSAKHDDGWWSGSLNGVEGMFPASYVEPHVAAPAASAAGDQYVAIHAFPRERDDDLALNVGDVVSVIDKSGEWWQGTLRGQTGWFPGNHVEKHTPAAAAAAPPAVPGGKTKAAAAIATAVTPSSSTSSDATSGSGKPLIGKVIAAHTPSSDSEIALTVGSLVQIIQRLPDGWWEGTVAAKGQKAQTGWFPGDCVQLMEKKGEKAGSSNSSTVGAPARPPAAAASTLPRTNSESSFVSEAPPQVPTKGASAAAGADASGATPAKVIVAYHAQNDGELSLTAGQLIKITQVTDDEMWHGTVISKNQKVSGYFPRKCVQVMVKGARPVSMMPQDEERAVAKFSYVAQNADELTLKENDVVIVKSKKEDGWWEGELNGRVGLFPANYVVSTEVNRKNLVS